MITLENLWISKTQCKSKMTQWKHKMMSKKMIMCLLRMMNLGYMILLISFNIPLKTMLNFANFLWAMTIMFWLSNFKIRIKMYLLLFCDESFYCFFFCSFYLYVNHYTLENFIKCCHFLLQMYKNMKENYNFL